MKESPFSGKTGITSITFPETLKGIPIGAFYECTNLEWIKFPEDLEFFDDAVSGDYYTVPRVYYLSEMFMNCYSLKTISMPNCTRIIGEKMFYGCKSLREVGMPNSLTYIGPSAFEGCSSLESITIPKNVKEICGNAFNGCEKLMTIYSEILEPFDIPENAFDEYTYKNAVLHIPQGTKSKYMACTGWKNFLKIRENGEYDLTELNVMIKSRGNGKVVFKDTDVRDDVKEFKVQTFFGRDLMFDIIPDKGSHVKNIECNNNDIMNKLVEEDDTMRYIQYDALNSLSLYVVFENDASDNVFTAKTIEGAELTYKVLDKDAKTVQVGTGKQGEPAIIGNADAFQVTIPKEVNGYQVVAVGEYAFADCSNLHSILIPWTPGFRIYDYAFSGCRKIQAVTSYANIPPGLDDLAYPLYGFNSNAFEENVYRDAMLFIPIGYKESYQNRARWAWNEFQHVVETAMGDRFTEQTEEGVKVEYTIISDADKTVQVGRGLWGTTAIDNLANNPTITIPETTKGYTVERIGYCAFNSTWSLKTVSIPATVSSIEYGAFMYCNLGTIKVWAETPPRLADEAFTYGLVKDSAVVMVPANSIEKYRQAEGWRNFKNIVALSDEKPQDSTQPDSTSHSSTEAIIEYFIDKDPGYGMANAVKETAGATDGVEIDLAGVTAGAHMLYVRSRDEQGRWSATIGRPLYVHPAVGVAAVEYFFDSNDPGQGKATKIAPPADAAKPYEFEVSLGNLSVGEHRLNVRVKGTDGVWSAIASSVFALTDNTGVESVQTEQSPSVVFDLRGMKANGQRGLRIVHYQDGKAKKVIIK